MTDSKQETVAMQQSKVSNDGNKDAFANCLIEMHHEMKHIVKKNKECIIHIWSKTPHASAFAALPSALHDNEPTVSNAKSEEPANIEDSNDAKVVCSMSLEDSKKKTHPSNEPDSEAAAKKPRANNQHDVAAANTEANHMCLRNFFNTSCQPFHQDNNYKCPFQEYTLPNKTLHAVLGRAKRAQAQLNTSEKAAYAKFSPAGAMPIMYYTSIDIKNDSASPIEYISTSLSQQGIRPSDVTYMALNNKIIFDRFLENADGMTYYAQDILRKRRAKASAKAGTDMTQQACFTLLPGQLLEYVLTFLNESHIVNMSLTCKSWNTALAGGSDGYWKSIMDQRGWSYTDSNENSNSSNRRRLSMRQKYIMQGTPFRDAPAIVEALNQLENGNGRDDFIRCRFNKKNRFPESPSTCVGLYVWSPTLLLAAYSYDCSLLLFEYEHNLDEKTKELSMIMQLNFGPDESIGGLQCSITSMAVDDTYIACLYFLIDNRMKTQYHEIIIVRRDEFLECRGANYKDEESLVGQPDDIRIEVSHGFLSYIKEHDGFSDITGLLKSYDDNGGQDWEIKVEATGNICACGDGLFMIEVMVTVPIIEYKKGCNKAAEVLGRRLVVVSAITESIVWAGPSLPMIEYEVFDYRKVDVYSGMMGNKRVIAIANTDDNTIRIGDIYPTTFQEGSTLTLVPYAADHYPGKMASNMMYHSAVVLESCIVSAEMWLARPNKEEERHMHKEYPNERQLSTSKSTITIYKLKDGFDNLYTSKHVVLPNKHDAYRVVELKDNFIGVICVDRTTPKHEDDESSGSSLDDEGKENAEGMKNAVLQAAMARQNQNAAQAGGDRSSGESDDDSEEDSSAPIDILRFLDFGEALTIGMSNYIPGGFAYDDDDEGDRYNLALLVYHVPSGRFAGKFKGRRFHLYTASTIPMIARGASTIATALYSYGVALTGPDVYGTI
jgi:F-box domain